MVDYWYEMAMVPNTYQEEFIFGDGYNIGNTASQDRRGEMSWHSLIILAVLCKS